MADLVEAIGLGMARFETEGGAAHKAATVVHEPTMFAGEQHDLQKAFVFTSRYEPSVSLYSRVPLSPPIIGFEIDHGYQELDYQYLGILNPLAMLMTGYDVNKMKTTLVANSYYWTE